MLYNKNSSKKHGAEHDTDNIVQIIPAPEGIYAHLEEGENKRFIAPVMCLALVEDSSGKRYIDFGISITHELHLASQIPNLLFIEHTTEYPKPTV